MSACWCKGDAFDSAWAKVERDDLTNWLLRCGCPGQARAGEAIDVWRQLRAHAPHADSCRLIVALWHTGNVRYNTFVGGLHGRAVSLGNPDDVVQLPAQGLGPVRRSVASHQPEPGAVLVARNDLWR